MGRLALLIPLAALACGPVAPEVAATRCEAEARAAKHPTGEIGFGVSSDRGPVFRGEINISTDYLLRRDPMLVYQNCVVRLTGQPPIRPPNL